MWRSWSILECSLGRGLRGLGEQEARPAHGQTVLKDLLSHLGVWEAQNPGSEFIWYAWS